MGQTVQHAKPTSVLVVGSGFAGASIAHTLARYGHQVTVVDPALRAGPAGTHCGHRMAALVPSLSRDDDQRSRLSRTGVALALKQWQTLPAAARPVRCGALQPVPASQQQAWQDALATLGFPSDWVRWANADEAGHLTGHTDAGPGLWFAQGHGVLPEALLQHLLNHPGIRTVATTVGRLEQLAAGQWRAMDAGGTECGRGQQLVLAAGALTQRLLGDLIGAPLPRRLQTLHAIAGQLSYFSAAPQLAPRSIVS